MTSQQVSSMFSDGNGPPRLLLVDAQIGMRERIAAPLRASGYEVITAGDAASAWQLLNQVPIDLVLTSMINLKPFDGFELIRRIMGDFPNTEVVAMSASRAFEVELGALRLGAREFLAKPFSEDQLLIRLARALEYRWLKGRALGPNGPRFPWSSPFSPHQF